MVELKFTFPFNSVLANARNTMHINFSLAFLHMNYSLASAYMITFKLFSKICTLRKKRTFLNFETEFQNYFLFLTRSLWCCIRLLYVNR